MKKTFFLWEDEYSVNISEIDNQHKKIIELLNLLYQSFVDNKHNQIIGKIIDELEAFTEYHFKTEEKYFKELDPDLREKHYEEHQFFIKKLNKFKEESQKNNTALIFTIINFLNDWLTNHILIEDKKYSQLVKSK